MSNALAVVVRTIALRDYAVTCREDGRWIGKATAESDAPLVLVDAETKGSAYAMLVDHICKNRREDIRAMVADIKRMERGA